MHLQIRTVPRRSNPDVKGFLEMLEEADVNVVAVAGGALELGGTIGIACHDAGGKDDTAKAHRKLTDVGYEATLVEEGMNPSGYLHLGRMRNQKGQLLKEVDRARRRAGPGYVVEDIGVGVPFTDDSGETVYPVQVFCVKEA